MPLPPKKNESKREFIGRCVSELSHKGEYNNTEQRVAVCYAYWKEYEKKKRKSKSILGRIINLWQNNIE